MNYESYYYEGDDEIYGNYEARHDMQMISNTE